MVPCIDLKHKGERKIKLEIDHIKEKIDGLTVKKSIKSSNDSNLNRSEVSIQNALSQMVDLTEESWRWSLDLDKSSRTEED